jgi:hypothetical protein
LPSSGTDLRGLAHKVHTGADLFKYRKAKDVKPDVYLSKQKNKDSNAPRTLESMGVLSDDGIQPDLLADAFGFPSVEAMVKALLTAPDPVSAIKRLTDEIMVQRHADLATPQAIEQAALAALHSEAHCIKPCAISLLRKSA